MAEVAIYQNKTEETKQYMIFTVGSEKYGIDVSYINNTIQMPSITRVPCAPKYFKGIINLRGEIVPVMSLSRRLLSMDREITKDSRIIILELEKSENKEDDQYELQASQQTMRDLCSTLQYNILEIPDLINNRLNNEKEIHIINRLYDIDNIVHKATKELRKEEVMDTFSKKSKINSKYIVKQINDFTRNSSVVNLTKYTHPVVKQKVNENNESEEVTINNESEKK